MSFSLFKKSNALVLTRIYKKSLIYMVHNKYIIRLIVEFLFIINLSGDINVADIFYKSSQA